MILLAHQTKLFEDWYDNVTMRFLAHFLSKQTVNEYEAHRGVANNYVMNEVQIMITFIMRSDLTRIKQGVSLSSS